jgi:uncharacterized protein
MPAADRRRILMYLVLTFAFSSFFYWQIIAAGKMRMWPTFGLMWCPGIAALITRLVLQRNLRGMGWGWGATRWQALSYLFPPVAGLVIYGLVWLTGIGGLQAAGLSSRLGLSRLGLELSLPVTLGLLATFGFVQAAVFALGEEIGWRGLLVPELAATTSLTKTALISGAVWAVYHYPLILFSSYNSGSPRWFSLLAFTWMVLAASFVFAWLRLKSGSLWTGVILHASHNLFIQSIFDPLTVNRGFTKYVTTEFGVGLALAYSLAAWYCWRKEAELRPAAVAVPAAAAMPAA